MNLSDFDFFLKEVEKFTKTELKKEKLVLLDEGKDITGIQDLFINNSDVLFTILSDGTLKRINLYIAEQVIYKRVDMFPKYKYHIFKCQTLIDMFNNDRKHRYKINARDDGTFYFRYINNYGRVLKEIPDEKIQICKNCLKKYFKLIHKKYTTSKGDEYVENFNLKLFNKQFGSFFENEDISNLEKGNSRFISNVYVKHWKEISDKVKKTRGYICERCGFKPKNNYEKKFIHTHHINGDKQNNREDNLQVLCIKCHSEIDHFHTRIQNLSDYKEFINIRR